MITARGLTKQYGTVRAVDDLSFEVAAGTVTGFLGADGAGRSTTMRMVLGLLPYDWTLDHHLRPDHPRCVGGGAPGRRRLAAAAHGCRAMTRPLDPLPGGPVTTARRTYALAWALALATVVLLFLGIGALGIVGDGDRDAIYLAVPAVLAIGAVAARLRAHRMAVALAATAATTLAVALVAAVLVVRAGEDASLIDIVMVSGLYAALFAGSAWLFRRSDRLA